MLLSPEWLGDMQFRWLKRSMHNGSIEKDHARGKKPNERKQQGSPHRLMIQNDGLVLSHPKPLLRPLSSVGVQPT